MWENRKCTNLLLSNSFFLILMEFWKIPPIILFYFLILFFFLNACNHTLIFLFLSNQITNPKNKLFFLTDANKHQMTPLSIWKRTDSHIRSPMMRELSARKSVTVTTNFCKYFSSIHISLIMYCCFEATASIVLHLLFIYYLLLLWFYLYGIRVGVGLGLGMNHSNVLLLNPIKLHTCLFIYQSQHIVHL